MLRPVYSLSEWHYTLRTEFADVRSFALKHTD